MSRDFSPDLDTFREAVREVREKPQESRRSAPAQDSRQRDESRTLSRLPEVQESRPREVPPKEARTVLYDRYRAYDLRESETQTLTDLGKFRVIAADDLARYGYDGDKGRMEQETTNLIRQGLVEEKRVEVSLSKTTRMYTLTKAGRSLLLKSDRVAKEQEIYCWFREAERGQTRQRTLSPLSEGILQDRGARRQSAPSRSRLRIEEESEPRPHAAGAREGRPCQKTGSGRAVWFARRSWPHSGARYADRIRDAGTGNCAREFGADNRGLPAPATRRKSPRGIHDVQPRRRCVSRAPNLE